MNDAEREREDFAIFAGRNRARLLAAYDAARAGRVPFCWPGLLFPQAWFLYRKMYVCAALVTVGPLALSGVPGAAYLDWSASVFGALGLRLYVAAARRTADRLRAHAPEEAPARLARAGGVSMTGALLGALYIFAIFVMTLKPGATPLAPPQ